MRKKVSRESVVGLRPAAAVGVRPAGAAEPPPRRHPHGVGWWSCSHREGGWLGARLQAASSACTTHTMHGLSVGIGRRM